MNVVRRHPATMAEYKELVRFLNLSNFVRQPGTDETLDGSRMHVFRRYGRWVQVVLPPDYRPPETDKTGESNA